MRLLALQLRHPGIRLRPGTMGTWPRIWRPSPDLDDSDAVNSGQTCRAGVRSAYRSRSPSPRGRKKKTWAKDQRLPV